MKVKFKKPKFLTFHKKGMRYPLKKSEWFTNFVLSILCVANIVMSIVNHNWTAMSGWGFSLMFLSTNIINDALVRRYKGLNDDLTASNQNLLNLTTDLIQYARNSGATVEIVAAKEK